MNYKSTPTFQVKKLIFSFLSKAFIPLLVFLFANITYSQNKIYWTQAGGVDKILRADLDGSNIEELVINLDAPEGIALDVISGKMYWTDRINHRIQRANLNGSNVQTIVSDLASPYGIALDTLNGKIYWVELVFGGADLIRRANIDGTNLEDLVVQGVFISKSGIALDIPRGKMYWAQGGNFGKIRRANLDGSNIEDLVTKVDANGIELDLTSDKIYWTEEGSNGNIKRVNLDGSNIEFLIISGVYVGRDVALDLEAGKMYWTAGGTDDKIHRANLDGTNIEDVADVGVSDPIGISLAKVPMKSLLIFPANSSTEIQTNPTLAWNPVKNSSSFQLQVSTDSTFTNIIIDQSSILNTLFDITDLTECTTYYWRIRAANAVGNGAWSDVWSFTTVIVEPITTTLVSPFDGKTSVPIDPTLLWNSSFCADSYQLQVATDSVFSTIIVEQSGISDTSSSVNGLLNDIEYYWRVRAINNLATSNWSEARSFTTIIEAPTEPTSLISPADSETLVATNPTMTWNASARAASYRLQVGTAVSFSTTDIDQGEIIDTTLSVNGLSNSTTYFWRVNATNEGGTNDWSSIWQFTTIETAPAKPTPTSPPDGATGIQTSPTLSWNAAGGATSYQLQVASSPSFSTPTVNQSGITETSFEVSGLLNNTNYFWRVNAMNEGGTSAWSTIWQLTTIIAAPAAPILTSPADSATGISTNQTLAWNPSDDATSYGLQISTLSDFSTLVVEESGFSANSFEAAGLEESSQYFWRVNATNEGGTSAWSPVWSFTTTLPSSVEQINNEIPDDFRLDQNYPNPFNPETTIEYHVAEAGPVAIKVYNLVGQKLKTLVNETKQPGHYKIIWNGTNISGNGVATGIYIVRMNAGHFIASRKIVLLR